MRSVLIWTLVALIIMPFTSALALAGRSDTADAIVAQNATPAVVNIAT
jgi:hypothetical protein